MMNVLIRFGESLLGGIGLVWLFLGAYYGLGPTNTAKLGFGLFLLIGISVGMLWFIVDGFVIAGYLKRSIEIVSNVIDTQITIMFADLFTQNGLKTISVNEYFDSAVDEKHVASNSLHGQMLIRYWAGTTASWDQQVDQELANVQPVEDCVRPAPGKARRYAIGTTAYVSINGNDFLCVAVAKTSAKSLEASATSAELQCAVRCLLSKARTMCSGRPLNIPLLGSGLARTGIKPSIIVELMLLAILEESKMRKITNHIRIVLPRTMKKRIDLAAIKTNWG